MIPRTLEGFITKRMRPNKVMLVFGARRVGKTILLHEICKKFNGKYMLLNGEDADTQNLLANKSIANYRLLTDGIQLLAIDEAQNISDIGGKLKLMVDEIPGLYVVASGSSSFDLQNKAGEPLVGRSSTFHLFPFTQAEIQPQENILQTHRNLDQRLIYGSYPEILSIDTQEMKKEYLSDIVNAYLLKDILTFDGIRNASKLKDLLRLIAFQIGSEVSNDELGRQLGLSKNTVERYLDLLAKVFVIFRLGGFSRNLRKEVVKSSKWYFYDVGIRNAIIGNFNPISLRQDMGALWENYIISEKIKSNAHLHIHAQSFFWRTYDRQEIDLIIENEGKIEAFECKWGKKIAKIPVAFGNAYPNAVFNTINKENYLEYIL